MRADPDRRAGLAARAPAPAAIRRATLADVAALVEIENASFPGNRLDRRRFRYLLAHAHGVILVDAVNGATELRGYVLLLFRSNSPVARVYSIATAARHVKQGVAAQLLRAAERLALDHGYTRQRLEIRADNAASLALFESRGYRRFGCHAAYYHDGMDAVRLEKVLER